MKKFFLSAALMPLAFAGFAQTEVPKDSLYAEIYFAETTHNFGAIEYRGNATYEFQFSNTGTDALRITNATSTCGCTVPTYSKEPIVPGGNGIITVKYDSSRQGAIDKWITVTSNAKANPSVRLHITGEVKAPGATPAK
ncbi:MAG: DUF1573 domain-containing protein [Prevotellaceae bacterium]|jgi:hypothetical protein|nr:DUF1573 domain-containing protein [Prevotellaceae bacterium]